MKSVRIKPEDWQWMKQQSIDRDKPLYEIQSDLIKCYRECGAHRIE